MSETMGPRSVARRWVGLALGILCIVLGAILLTRPFSSLAVLILVVAIAAVVAGISDIAGREREASPRLTAVVGSGWILVGIAILVWPGLSLRGLALIVGIALIVSGGARIASAIRGTADQRGAAILLGAASVILGLAALAWPDITLLVVAVVFGIRLILVGLAGIGDAIRGHPVAASEPGRVRRWAKTGAAALVLVVAIAAAGLSLRINEGVATPDAFYDAPTSVPDQPGRLIRSESFTRVVPTGAQMWRILYTTTRADGVPAVASALVAAPVDRPAGPLPVIAWSHGTTGVDPNCAPSLLPTGIESGSPNAIDQVISQGWVMVSTDYSGLGTEAPHAYLVGEQAGRSVLDAVRAARQMSELQLSEKTVVWGHSQGGGGALWTGMLASTYAPDTNVIGVAALSPASDLPGLVANLENIDGGAIFASYVIDGYANTYPDVEFTDYIRPTAQLQVREMAGRCLTSEALVSAIQTFLFDKSIWALDPTTGPFAARLAENIPLGPIEAPLLIGQGAADVLVLPAAQAAYVERRCNAGYAVDYRTYPGEDHISVVQPDSPLIPELIAWTQDRLAGKPPTPTCGG
jgi:uncharacterized membrane protein HdeD (DUF308 family)/alpha-beta hydrolase superfamily lysophospholipase